MLDKGKAARHVAVILFGMACLTCSFSIFRGVNEWQVTGKWAGAYAAFTVLLAYMLVLHIAWPDRMPGASVIVLACSRVLALCNVAVAVSCLLQVTGLVGRSVPNFVTSDFDNPAGVAALFCATLPACVSATGNEEGRVRLAPVLAVFVLDMAVLCVAGSRAGVIALACGMAVLALSCIKGKRGRIVAVLALAVAVVAAVWLLSRMAGKSASVSGRLLILDTCRQMVTDRPLSGYGPHGFGREYMLYQAAHLSRVSDDGVLLLSDNVSHPLCEYALVVVNFGLAGLAVLLAAVTLLTRAVIRRGGRMRTPSIMLICSLGLLSMFSYPFRYPMTLLALLLCILPQAVSGLRLGRVMRSRAVAVAALALIAVSVWPFVSWYRAQRSWYQMTDGMTKDTSCAASLRNTVMPVADAVLSRNPRYLYSRAVSGYYAGEYDSCLADARASSARLASYDTEMLLGGVFRELGQPDSSAMHFRKAAAMCPSRISPLYYLFLLYESQGDTAGMAVTGRQLLSKPVKVPSAKTRAMRLDVRKKI